MMDSELVKKLVKPYVAIILLQFVNAGYNIISKAALNEGSNHFTISVYRNAFAAASFLPLAIILERKNRPRITLSTFIKILLLGTIDPVIGQNTYFVGLKYSSPTLTSALGNLVPAITFLLAWMLRIEKVKLKEISTHAKIVGTLVTVGGAMMMSLIRGPVIGLPWTHHHHHQIVLNNSSTDHNNVQDPIKGTLMIIISCITYSSFYILQGITLKSYPAELTLITAVSTVGAVIGTVLTFAVEKGNTAIWALGWNAKLLAYVYNGVFTSGIGYYLAGVVIQEKGPVFATSFTPLSLIIVAILSSFIFSEEMRVGKISGAVVIVIGLYMVLWGKRKDEKEAELIEQQKQHNASTMDTSPLKEDYVFFSSHTTPSHNVV